MSGSTLGTLFRVTNFGESHGPAIGCVIDGCPPGLALAEADMQADLDRRRPGTSRHVTQRNEADRVEILSGVHEGVTTGTPIALLIRNTDQRSRDYGNLLDTFRPGHADYTYWQKYGLRDARGGGRASARLTAPMVAAGAVAKKWLAQVHGTRFVGWMTQIGDIVIPFEDETQIALNPFFAPNAGIVARLEAHMDALRKAGDSCGARLTVTARQVPVGLGEPLFDKLDADIAHAMMGINAVKGVEIGAGFGCVTQRGSEHGDELSPQGFLGNHAGGVLGGISSGQDLVVSIAVKPTSSIHTARRSIDRSGAPTVVQTVGRHDPCVGIRATPIAEAMLALVVMDHVLRHRAQCGDVVAPLPPIAPFAPFAARGVNPVAPPFRALPFGALWFCYFGAIGLFSPYSPLWLSHLGYSTLAIGAFASLQSWTRVVAPYGWGWLADHGGRRVPLLRAAALISVLAAGGLWLARDAGVWALAAVVAVLFLANGAVTPIAEAMLLRHLHSGAGLDARRYGHVRVWGSIGFIVAVLAFGFVLQRTGIGALPLFTLVLFALLALASWALPGGAEQSVHIGARVAVWPVLRQPAVMWFFATVMLTVLAHSALYAFFSLYLSALGYGKPAVGMFWAVSVAAEIVFFAFAGRFFSGLSELRWLLLAACVTVVRFAATAAFGDVPALLVVAQMTHALTFAAQHMACTSLIARHFPERLRARGQALYSTLGYGVPGVVGGVAGGLVSEAFGLAAVFWAAAGVALGSAACCVMAARAHR